MRLLPHDGDRMLKRPLIARVALLLREAASILRRGLDEGLAKARFIMSTQFDSLYSRYQAEKAVAADRVAKGTSVLMWVAASTKLLVHGHVFEAALALTCAFTSLALLAFSCWRRCCYVRRVKWLTAAALLQAHIAASVLCVAGYSIMSGRHSDNVLRFAFIMGISNTGLFQALAALQAWPLLGMRLLVPVQLASVAVMVPRMRDICQVALGTDEGAPRLFAAASWVLRQAFSLIDAGPSWAPSSRGVHAAECLQVNTWWLLLCCAASTYINWMMEQRARERFARQLGPAGQRQLRHLMQRHPMYSHHRPALLMAIELFAMAAIIWELLQTVLPWALHVTPAGAMGWNSGSQGGGWGDTGAVPGPLAAA